MIKQLTFYIYTDKPDAPGVPEITEVGCDFVSLTWEKPKHDGGGRIKGYWIDKREHGTDNWSRVNLQPCITNIINIPKLIEDKRYEFRVFAENEAGMSKPSMNSQAVKIKDPKGKIADIFPMSSIFCVSIAIMYNIIFYAVTYGLLCISLLAFFSL